MLGVPCRTSIYIRRKRGSRPRRHWSPLICCNCADCRTNSFSLSGPNEHTRLPAWGRPPEHAPAICGVWFHSQDPKRCHLYGSAIRHRLVWGASQGGLPDTRFLAWLRAEWTRNVLPARLLLLPNGLIRVAGKHIQAKSIGRPVTHLGLNQQVKLEAPWLLPVLYSQSTFHLLMHSSQPPLAPSEQDLHRHWLPNLLHEYRK